MVETQELRSSGDVVAFLTGQHEEIKRLFGVVRQSRGEPRSDAFFDLRRLLAVHETAEEEVVHPRAENTIPEGRDIVAARLAEEHEAKEALAALEKMDADSDEFESGLEELESSVLAHASAEESLEFARLESDLEPDQLERMRRAAETAERMAPTRPHAGVESASANKVLGPFAAMLDRARDAIRG